MVGQGKLISIFNVLGNYRNFLANRITVSINQQQNANLKTKTREHLKNLKIPEQPKRPLTPYFRFLIEKRPQIQKQHPNWKLVEIAKQCGEDWKNLSKDVKEKYQQDYNDEAKIYQHKQEQFKISLTKEQQEALNLAEKEKRQTRKKRIIKKRYRETGKPKRPTGTFIFFIKDKQVLPENKNKKLTELLSLYKNEWNGMSDSAKQKYVEMHEKDKERYEKEITAWEARMIKEGNMDIIRKESQITSTAKPLQLDNVKQKKNK